MVRCKIKTKDGLRKTTLEFIKKASVKTEAFFIFIGFAEYLIKYLNSLDAIPAVRKSILIAPLTLQCFVSTLDTNLHFQTIIH
jgi:hypothetical protein